MKSHPREAPCAVKKNSLVRLLLLCWIMRAAAFPLNQSTPLSDHIDQCDHQEHLINCHNCHYLPASLNRHGVDASDANKLTNIMPSMKDESDHQLRLNHDYTSIRRVEYKMLHPFWLNKKTNFNQMRGNQTKPKKVLKINWTMDETNMTDNMRFIIIRERDNMRLFQRPYLVEVSRELSLHDKLTIVQHAIQEAFDIWSSALCGYLIFQYIPYNLSLQLARHFSSVVLVSKRNLQHVDEHGSTLHFFFDNDTMAHASYNYIHLNGETNRFYLAPHRMSRSIYLQREYYHQGIPYRFLTTIDSEVLAHRYHLDYATFYHYNRNLIYQLAGANNAVPRADRYVPFVYALMHEIGHVLGLGHSSNTDQSIMKPYTTNVRESIMSDSDRKAIRILYREFLKRAGQNVRRSHNVC